MARTVIVVVTGGNTQAAVARSLASLLRPDEVILLIQDNTGGSLIVGSTPDVVDELGERSPR
jgi:hypothetical protein